MNKDQSHIYEVVDFDEIMNGVVATLDPIQVGGAFRQPQFYFGTTVDLAHYLNAKRESHFPLAFSVTKDDQESDVPGISVRTQAEINLCTPETNTDLLNVERLARSYSLVLKPFWEAIHKAIDKSPYITIRPGTLGFAKYPNWAVSGGPSAPVIWDVLRVRFDAEINIDFYCNSQK